jgi:pteridine reductase
MEHTTARVALITGAARRVGRATALRLAEAGFDVALTYLSSRDEAMELAEQIARLGRRALAICADLADPQVAVERIAGQFNAAFDRLDVLVNNASLFEPDDPARFPGQLRRMMAIHVESPTLLCQALADELRLSQGHIVNMVDILAERPWPAYSAYCASKAALASLTRSWARLYAPEVTVNAIAPGVVEWRADVPEDQRQKYLQRVPLGRAGSPNDVANLVHFLATEGTYITGRIIRVDGGRSMG